MDVRKELEEGNIGKVHRELMEAKTAKKRRACNDQKR